MMAPDSDSMAPLDAGLIVSREIYRFKELVEFAIDRQSQCSSQNLVIRRRQLR
jgi:hypothetical protein